MYQALYRKYRPKTFDDVCGQEAIITTLKNEISTGKASHAYLFTGLRGSGKTTCSKIIAKAVNCLRPVEGNPCCECDICLGIDNDSITDVMEIDAASNSGVDYMRELREQAFFRPVLCKKRVYIIDEAHMLSSEAFNALLKIMEEPPEHVLFILATTEVHKVPPTIISRCQRFDFGRIPPEAIADRLSLIAKVEGFTVEREAALLLARLSEGGMRDAISLLDQCWSHTSDITLSVVAQCAGISSSEGLFSLSDRVGENDCPGALVVLSDIVCGSTDNVRLCEQLIGHFRNLMLAKCTDKPERIIVCLPDELARYKESASSFSVEKLLLTVRSLQDCLVRMSRAPDKRVELEMAVVRISGEAEGAAAKGTGSGASGAEVSALTIRIEKLENQLKKALAAHGSAPHTPAQHPGGTPASPPPSKKTAPSQSTLLKKAVPFERWPEVLSQLAEKNKALYGALAGSDAYFAEDVVLIHSKNELFLKMIRENEYSKQHIHDCIIEVTGRKYRLGPYRPEHYNAEKNAVDPLDAMLETAGSEGVPVNISGQKP